MVKPINYLSAAEIWWRKLAEMAIESEHCGSVAWIAPGNAAIFMRNHIAITARGSDFCGRAPVTLHTLRIGGALWSRAGSADAAKKVWCQLTSITLHLGYRLKVARDALGRAVVATADEEPFLARRRNSVRDPERNMATRFETSVDRWVHLAVVACQLHWIPVVAFNAPCCAICSMFELESLLASGLPARRAIAVAFDLRVENVNRLWTGCRIALERLWSEVAKVASQDLDGWFEALRALGSAFACVFRRRQALLAWRCFSVFDIFWHIALLSIAREHRQHRKDAELATDVWN